MRVRFLALLLGLIMARAGSAQSSLQTAPPQEPPQARPRASAQHKTVAPTNKDTRRQFVLDVVKSAVALPQPDPADRLRVLATATQVISPLDSKYAKQLAREGMQLESELVRSGQQSPVSIMATGQVDCATAAEFVQSVPAQAISTAEQSLIGAITTCPKQALGPAQLALSSALSQGESAPRALLAAIDATGAKSRWSQDVFERQFSSLPKDYENELKRAPDFSALFESVAPEAPRDTVRKAGLELLEWLSKVSEGGERNMAINGVTSTMQTVLGDDEYQDALSSNVVARDVARQAGQPGEIKPAEEESVSVLEAMSSPQEDRTESLDSLSTSQRARQAAAYAFAANQSGDRKLADHYFDIAFSAADDVWRNRNDQKKNAVAVVQEVSDASAQVDPIAALNRAQGLQDPTAQAIGMLAVAAVVGHAR